MENLFFKAFLRLCKRKNSDQLSAFFALFFTLEEQQMLEQRHLIIQALLKGDLTQREIGKKYKVSISQITRGSNALKQIDPVLKEYLKNQVEK